jgi:hypothetical protein
MKAKGIVPRLGGGACYMEEDDARSLALYLNWSFWFGQRDRVADIIRPLSVYRGGGYPKSVEAFLETGPHDFEYARYEKSFQAVKWGLTVHAQLLPFRDLPLHPGIGDL